MSSLVIAGDENFAKPRSTISCHVCRKRKTKCGRELPHCSLCVQSSQPCEYPAKALRPGPKIGSVQNPRKRQAQLDETENNGAKRKRRRTSCAESPDYSASSRANQQTLLHQATPTPAAPRRQSADMQSLSFILHPSHESCSPEDRYDGISKSPGQNHEKSHWASSCYSLGITPEHLNRLIDRYFETFTSFQLFREHQFRATLQCIETPAQSTALLAAMLAFATKSSDYSREDDRIHAAQDPVQSSHFSGLALRFVDLAMHECEDDPLPLPLLQALILITHWLLIQGVRGRAWRYLGLAIQSAYELNMHLIDAGRGSEHEKIQPTEWCEDEERRRAWWAIWELDVFASVIRRCPTGIDWSQNETFLPAEDDRWSRGVPQRSCALEPNLVNRWKALKATGNQSPKAWFIVINSLMKDAQKITSPVGIDKGSSLSTKQARDRDETACDGRRTANAKITDNTLNRLATIQNATHCTIMAIPVPLKYENQYLSFGSRETDRQATASRRLLHSSIYSIHIMTQLTKLMIQKYSIFSTGTKGSSVSSETKRVGCQSEDSKHHHFHPDGTSVMADSLALEQYAEAAHGIVSMVQRSFEDHHKYVNPFVANTIWLAGAVQLLYRELAPLGLSDKDLVNSNFDVLSITYDKFVGYWNMPSTMQKNLEMVQSELENLHSEQKNYDRISTNRLKRSRAPATQEGVPGNPGNVPKYTQPPVDGHGSEKLSYDRTSNMNITSLAGVHTRSADSQNIAWSSSGNNIYNDNTQNNGYSADFDFTQQQIFEDAASANQAALQRRQHGLSYPTQTGSGDGTGSFKNLPSASQQLPTNTQYMQSKVMFRAPSSQTCSAGTDGRTAVSPDFVDRPYIPLDFSASNIYLPSYLDEIFSGSYLA